MLSVTLSERIEALVDPLAERMSDVPADPFTPQTVVVATVAMRSWLRRELARRLGSAQSTVAANIDLLLPGTLRQRVLDAYGLDARWANESLAWSVFASMAPGSAASDWVRARRVADLFDRYHLHRPQMIRHWAAGRDLDEEGRALVERYRWQPERWRDLRRRIGVPSPPEVAATALSAPPDVAAVGMGERLDVFGLSSFSTDLLAWLSWLSNGVDIGVFALALTPTDVDTDAHPLGRSWGRPAALSIRDLLGRADAITYVEPSRPSEQRQTMLHTLQDDLRRGRAPSPRAADAAEAAEDGDRSIEVHGCAGRAAQIETIRNAIGHAFNADPTLTEGDVAILVPSIADFAPLIDATLPAPFELSDGSEFALRYRMADRQLANPMPTARAMMLLLDVVAGRSTASEVLALLAQPAVSRRFDFGAEDHEQFGQWREALGTRWGLDGAQRAVVAGLPDDFPVGTWLDSIDRLMLGAALGPTAPVPGALAPYPCAHSEIEVAAGAAAVVEVLRAAVVESLVPRPISGWMERFESWCEALFEDDPFDAVEALRARQTLRSLQDTAREATEGHPIELSFDQFRQIVGEALNVSGPSTPNAVGVIAVSSPAALRALPYRIVVLAGLDSEALVGSPPSTDDLLALHPIPADPDARAEQRHQFLSAVMAASERLIITYSARSDTTNLPTPRSVPLDEMLDAMSVSSGRSPAQLVFEHPLSPFDPDNFRPTQPWSFDADRARAAAQPRRAYRGVGLTRGRTYGDVEPIADLSCRELVEALLRPMRQFRNNTGGYRTFRHAEEPEDELPLVDDPRSRSQLIRQLIWSPSGDAMTTDLRSALGRLRRSGAVAIGAYGEQAYTVTRRATALFAWRIRTSLLGDAAPEVRGPLLDPEELRFDIGEATLVDSLMVCRRGNEPTVVIADYGKREGLINMRVWVTLLALRAAGWDVSRAVVVNGDKSAVTSRSVTLRPWVSAAAARAELAHLVGRAQRARVEVLAVTPETSAAFAAAMLPVLDKRGLIPAAGLPPSITPTSLPAPGLIALTEARARWEGGDFTFGERDDPDVMRLVGSFDVVDWYASALAGIEAWELFGPMLLGLDIAKIKAARFTAKMAEDLSWWV